MNDPKLVKLQPPKIDLRKYNGLNRMGPDAMPNGAGRPVGSKDKIGTDLKKAILEAAAELGRDGQGAEGLVGYLKMLGAQYPQTYASLLHRMIPLQMSADVQGGVTTVNIMSVPSGTFANADALAGKLYDPGDTIEHEQDLQDDKERHHDNWN